MSENVIREPIQKRSIEKKEKIIKAGFDLICQKGYYNTNTAEIAKAAGVSTGIVYNYFNDKHDILIEGMKKYATNIFFPMFAFDGEIELSQDNLREFISATISTFIKNHKISKIAHEEITAMTHSDEAIAEIYHDSELKLTENFTEILTKNGFEIENMLEKVHLVISLIDNLCHEIIYHQHDKLDYDVMTEIVIDHIVYLINS